MGNIKILEQKHTVTVEGKTYDCKFLIANQEKVAVLHEVADNLICRKVYVDPFGNEVLHGEKIILPSEKVSDIPLRPWIITNIKDLDNQVKREQERLNAELKSQRKKLSDLKKLAEAEIAVVTNIATKNEKAIKTLELVKDVLLGNITHVVEVCRSFRYDRINIFEFSSTLAVNEKYDTGPLKLMSLYGKSNGDISFGTAEYSDGSGTMRSVTPCRSLEEAKDVATKYVYEIPVENYNLVSETFINNCRSLGITPPAAMVEAIKQNALAAIDAELALTKKKLEEQTAKRAALL